MSWLFGVYVLGLGVLGLYSVSQWYLLVLYLWDRGKKKSATSAEVAEWPMVTLQLPIYNERYVVGDLMEAVGRLDYPDEGLEVQVLDDSTDETSEIIVGLVEELGRRRPMLRVVHLRRVEREGFKAGALAAGLVVARGEFVAIFDADFEPAADFLKRTVGVLLGDAGLGLVQTRWGHKNEGATLLTRLQALALDAHFSIEQGGRSAGGLFMNFNGTAGLWRRAAIEAGGGWSSETLTEDLDLSYRVQLAGWRLSYLEEVSSPAELPEGMSAIRGQQYRWNKGAAEVARKVLGSVWGAGLPLGTKWQATVHLFNSSTFVLVFVSSVLSVPLNLWGSEGERAIAAWIGGVLGLGLLLFVGVGFFSRRAWGWGNVIVFLGRLPLFVGGMYGLSFYNSVAVVEGWMGRRTPFIRTPKTGRTGAGRAYLRRGLSGWWWIELLLMLFFLGAGVLGVMWGQAMPLHFLIAGGYGLVVWSEGMGKG